MIDLFYIDSNYYKKFNDITDALCRCIANGKDQMADIWITLREKLLQKAIAEGEYKKPKTSIKFLPRYLHIANHLQAHVHPATKISLIKNSTVHHCED
jgi:ABC-type thiamine transport system substrate-binding protein